MPLPPAVIDLLRLRVPLSRVGQALEKTTYDTGLGGEKWTAVEATTLAEMQRIGTAIIQGADQLPSVSGIDRNAIAEQLRGSGRALLEVAAKEKARAWSMDFSDRNVVSFLVLPALDGATSAFEGRS